MAVQQAMVNAKKAEQDAITVAKQGEAEAAKAKWAQEVLKATAVTAAEQEKEVATVSATQKKEVAALDLDTAKLSAQRTMALAKAEADAKKLQLEANNALEQRLGAWVEINKAWASAAAAQRPTPDVVFGSNSGGAHVGTNAFQLMDLWTVKAARDLGVNPSPKQ